MDCPSPSCRFIEKSIADGGRFLFPTIIHVLL